MRATSGRKTKSFILWAIEYVQDIYIYILSRYLSSGTFDMVDMPLYMGEGIPKVG
jgi:hypothetical protein